MFQRVAHGGAIQLQMALPRIAFVIFWRFFLWKLNVPVERFLSLSSSASCLVPFVVVIVLSPPEACLCLDFDGQILLGCGVFMHE